MILGDFELLAQLGAGRDGVAYRAWDRASGRHVEVRVLAPARGDPVRWQALARRLHLVAMLDHPNMVKVCGSNLQDNPPYVAVEGIEDLDARSRFLEAVPLPVPQAVTLSYDLASAVAAAHRLGLMHTRICPGTLRFGGAHELKIDFTDLEVQEAAASGPDAVLDAGYKPPEASIEGYADPAGDIYRLGATLHWVLTGKPPTSCADAGEADARLAEELATRPASLEIPSPLRELVREMLSADPDRRPLARDVESRLGAIMNSLGARAARVVPGQTTDSAWQAAGNDGGVADSLSGTRLGRFSLLEKLGQGAMGTVYRAEDLTDGSIVAVKVLRPDSTRQPHALQRLQKEARLLAEVNNPFVANLLEFNEDNATHYLAIEFVPGRSLRAYLEECGRLEETRAVSIIADVARGLVLAHDRGIVHRDIKPANIILAEPSPGAEADRLPRAKLLDFGLARQVNQSESLELTTPGMAVGTPLYMAPEQCTGTGKIDPRTDVYALGANLFHLLAGRPPFVANDAVGTLLMHCTDPVPPLKQFNPEVSDAVCQIVEKALAKAPDARYADAGALLRDLDRLLRGEPTSMTVHPVLPRCDPSRMYRFDWVWDLAASPVQLWPYVSNTERLNRAVGLPAVEFTAGIDAADSGHFRNRVRRYGKFRKAGFTNAWEEHPFEWIEARRMGVLREYSQGVFKWMVSVVELEPLAGGGTRLHHQVRLEPSGFVGRFVAAVEVGIRGRKTVERVYRRIDEAVNGQLGCQPSVDAFEAVAGLSGARRRRLEQRLERLRRCGVDAAIVERLGEFLANASVQDVSRIRPLALADRLGVDPEPFVDACLHAAREGLLVLLWDVLCPLCRIPSQIKDTLRELREHGHCEACNLDFKLDFTSSVEMIFRVHPEIRNAELGVYCIGGPVHFPHVVSQVRVAPEERIELPLGLTEGAYRFRGPQLPYAIDFRVHPQARATHWELSLGHGPSSELPRTLKTGVQVLAVTNDHHEELIVRVERTASRKDAVTAARASTLPLFRDLFPGEILSPGQLISVATITLLVTRLDLAGNLYRELGDARAFGLVHEHFRTIEEHARRESGALVKTVNEGLVLAFDDAAAAVRVALNLQPLLARNEITQQLRLGVGVHRGPALAATLNEQLDYFGTTVNVVSQLAELAAGGEVLLTQAVAADPQVAALLQARRLSAEILTASLLAEPEFLIHRLAASEHTVPDRDKVAGVESGQHELAHGLSSVPTNGKSEPASTR